ncbi:MAG TPA: glycosyltransferase [Streptosporangiaceae bacterium]
MSDTPVVVYLAGSGRSGSTLLERALGEQPGFVNVGELIDLFRRVAPRDELCGCGEPFSDCKFWSAVGERTHGGWTPGQLAATRRLQSQVARQRQLPRLLAPRLAGPEFTAALDRYGGTYRGLYQAIAAQAGADCVVDASKWPAQALALFRAGLDVRVIHLVRDSRGVAYSLSRQHVTRPHAVHETDEMWHVPPASAAARWLACQSEADLLRGCGMRVTRLRYEDFVARPAASVTSALRALGLPPAPGGLAHIADGQLSLGRTHGLSGNPSRFSDGDVRLRPDEAWRTGMSRRDRAVVTAITLPQLLRHRAGWPAVRSLPGVSGGPPPEGGDWPLVSVIVPTRGRPELVRASIAGVNAQDYQGEIEIIVVHDQEPPDQRLTSLAAARRSVSVLANSRAAGLAGARNTGVAAAAGELIAGCDDDDVWHPDKLRLQVAMLRADPGLLAVGSGLRLCLPGGRSVDWPARAETVSYRTLLRSRVKELHSSTLVMRREAFALAGSYDEDLPGGFGEDYDWVLRLARAGRVGAVTAPLADVRKDDGSWYADRTLGTVAGLEYLLAKHQDIAASRRGHARVLGQIALAHSMHGDRRAALSQAGQVLRRWPASPHGWLALGHVATGMDPARLRRLVRRLGRGRGVG